MAEKSQRIFIHILNSSPTREHRILMNSFRTSVPDGNTGNIARWRFTSTREWRVNTGNNIILIYNAFSPNI
jgi:hypothetical protein